MTQLVETEGTLSMIHFAISDFSDVYKKNCVVGTACASQTSKPPVEQKAGTGAVVC